VYKKAESVVAQNSGLNIQEESGDESASIDDDADFCYDAEDLAHSVDMKVSHMMHRKHRVVEVETGESSTKVHLDSNHLSARFKHLHSLAEQKLLNAKVDGKAESVNTKLVSPTSSSISTDGSAHRSDSLVGSQLSSNENDDVIPRHVTAEDDDVDNDSELSVEDAGKSLQIDSDNDRLSSTRLKGFLSTKVVRRSGSADKCEKDVDGDAKGNDEDDQKKYLRLAARQLKSMKMQALRTTNGTDVKSEEFDSISSARKLGDMSYDLPIKRKKIQRDLKIDTKDASSDDGSEDNISIFAWSLTPNDGVGTTRSGLKRQMTANAKSASDNLPQERSVPPVTLRVLQPLLGPTVEELNSCPKDDNCTLGSGDDSQSHITSSTNQSLKESRKRSDVRKSCQQ
jgi:hypothetical protein